jgi:hypothetical protein
MLTLASSGSLQGKAGTASAITYTVSGDTIASGNDTFQILAQGQLTGSVAALTGLSSVTAPTLISDIHLSNTTGSAVSTVQLYVNGTASSNQILNITIPANGQAVYANDGWKIYDGNGGLQTVGSIGATGPSGSGGSAGPQGATGATGAIAGLAAYGSTANADAASLNGSNQLVLQPASSSFSGLLTSTNYGNINNYFANGFYNVQDYGVSPANSASANVTALQTLLNTTATNKSTIYFPPGTYSFNAGITGSGTGGALPNDYAFEGRRGQTTIAITAAMGSGVPFIKLLNTGFYSSFKYLNFVGFTTAQSGNYVIQCQNNANTEITDCFFTSAVTWAGVIDFTGTNAGNGAILKNIYIANWTGKAINVSSPLDTMYIEDLEIVGAGTAGQVGIFCDNGGAMLMSNSQIISADINMELAPTTGNTVSAVFLTNCFFDQGKTNSLLITGSGTGTVARCHFVGSWFTISGTASAGGAGTNTKCIQINSSGTGIHAGIEFQCCWIMNATTGSTGTLEGVLATAVQDITVSNCQVANWTNGIHITPPTTANVTSVLINGNNIGPAGLIAANTTGILLDAGAPTVYAGVSITGNMINGNTTQISDASTVTLAASKNIANNVGLVNTGLVGAYAASRLALTASSANLIPGTSLQIPTNSLRVGSRIRFTIGLEKTAAGLATWTAAVKFGTANTTADGAIASWTSGTNTAIADGGVLTIEVQITAIGSGTSATCTGVAILGKGPGAQATGLGALGPGTTSTTAFNSTLASPYFHVDITPGASAVMTADGLVEVIA